MQSSQQPIFFGQNIPIQYRNLLLRLKNDGVPLPSQAQQNKDITLINQLVLDNNFAKCDTLNILGWYSAAAALYNWANPLNTTFGKCSYVGTMSAAEWTANTGYATKAASGLNSNYNESASHIAVTADKAAIWGWCEAGFDANNIYNGVANGNGKVFYAGAEAGTCYERINTLTSSTEASGSISGSTKFMCVKRINSTQVEIWFGNSLFNTITRNYDTLANDFAYYLALKTGTIYVPSAGVVQYACGIGGDIDVSKLYLAIANYKAL